MRLNRLIKVALINLILIMKILAKKQNFVVDNLIGVTYNQNGYAILITEKECG